MHSNRPPHLITTVVNVWWVGTWSDRTNRANLCQTNFPYSVSLMINAYDSILEKCFPCRRHQTKSLLNMTNLRFSKCTTRTTHKINFRCT